MKSPFPGMDPFIEACGLWGDFHHGLVCNISKFLCGCLPTRYVARMGTREYLDRRNEGTTLIEEEFREPFVTILDLENGSDLVTCIEVMSPSNKQPRSLGRGLYLRKRQNLLQSGSANLIEIDLLRCGQRMPMNGTWPSSPYTLLLARKGLASECMVWAADCVIRLPVIPVPLQKPDPDVVLDMQPIIDAIYAESRYHRSIDYTRTLTPPLTASETAFLKS